MHTATYVHQGPCLSTPVASSTTWQFTMSCHDHWWDQHHVEQRKGYFSALSTRVIYVTSDVTSVWSSLSCLFGSLFWLALALDNGNQHTPKASDRFSTCPWHTPNGYEMMAIPLRQWRRFRRFFGAFSVFSYFQPIRPSPGFVLRLIELNYIQKHLLQAVWRYVRRFSSQVPKLQEDNSIAFGCRRTPSHHHSLFSTYNWILSDMDLHTSYYTY